MKGKSFRHLSIFSILMLSLCGFSVNAQEKEQVFADGWIDELRTAIFITSPPDIFISRDMIGKIRNSQEINYIDSLDEVLEEVLERIPNPGPALNHGINTFVSLKADIEVAILDLTLVKKGIEDADEQVDFLLAAIERKGIQSDSVFAEKALLHQRATLFTPVLLEKMDSKEQDWYPQQISRALGNSKAEGLEQAILERIEDYQEERITYLLMLSILSRYGGMDSFIFLREKYRQSSWGDKIKFKSALKQLNAYSSDRELKTEVINFLTELEEEGKAAKRAAILAEEERRKEKPSRKSFSRPEDRGEDLSSKSTTALLALFRNADLAEIYAQRPYHKNEKAIELRKVAVILGNRNIENKLDLNSVDQELMKKVVEYYLDLSKQDKTMPGAFEEGALQIQRLWHLTVPTLLENIAGENNKRRETATQFIMDMRDEEITKAFVKLGRAAKTQRDIRWYYAILKGMKYPPHDPYGGKEVIDLVSSEKLYEELVLPVVMRLSSIKE